ncbi:MAG TPA: hypothetical protein VNF07_12765 [Acidimicrobiales bacterium]|nr:hypothetical protein [Acidimicrobiales bacterium]
MPVRIEWRHGAEGEGALLAVEESTETVVKAWPANPELLTDFLNEMVEIKALEREDSARSESIPGSWGELVIARSEDGEVLDVDPQLYWEGIAELFRSHGTDPHLWRSRH